MDSQPIKDPWDHTLQWQLRALARPRLQLPVESHLRMWRWRLCCRRGTISTREGGDVVERRKQRTLELLGCEALAGKRRVSIELVRVERRDDKPQKVLLAAVADADSMRNHRHESAPEPRVARHIAGREHKVAAAPALGVRRVAVEWMQLLASLERCHLKSQQMTVDTWANKIHV